MYYLGAILYILAIIYVIVIMTMVYKYIRDIEVKAARYEYSFAAYSQSLAYTYYEMTTTNFM